MIRSRWALAALACILAISACERPRAEENVPMTESQAVVPSPPPPAAGAEPTEGVFADRLPAEPDRTVLIPATALVPGQARVDPGVANPYAGDPAAVAAGGRHYDAFNCSGCHAPSGGGGMGPPLSDDVWIYGGSPGQVYLSIIHGRPDGMPAWGAMLPKKTVWELVAYIETLPDVDNPRAVRGFEEREEPRSPSARRPGRAEQAPPRPVP